MCWRVSIRSAPRPLGPVTVSCSTRGLSPRLTSALVPTLQAPPSLSLFSLTVRSPQEMKKGKTRETSK